MRIKNENILYTSIAILTTYLLFGAGALLLYAMKTFGVLTVVGTVFGLLGITAVVGIYWSIDWSDKDEV